jgi:hypothetical protein
MQPATIIWNGTPIEYYEHAPAEVGTTFLSCLDYLWRGGTPRYVAIQGGKIVAVQVDSWFCNQVVNPLFEGTTTLFAPHYERVAEKLVYRVPFVRAENFE